VSGRSHAYRDADRDVDARIKDLLGRMTLDEKLQQLGGVEPAELAGPDGFDPVRGARLLGQGIGCITRIGGVSGLGPAARVRMTNAIQRYLVEQTRLGIPAIVVEDAVAGYCARGATQFPQAIGVAATWAPDDVRAMADAVRVEMLSAGARLALGPVLDIARDPRWGRLEETFGEGAYLAGRLGVACVRGLQTGDLRSGVLAAARHFVGGGLSEGGMNHAPVQLGPRELREAFAEPFAAAVRDAGVRGMVCGGSAVDGAPPAASPELLDELLRSELGFDGLVVADDSAIARLVDHHGVAGDKAAAAVLALGAGVDVELPALDCCGEPLKGLIEAGKLEATVVDAAVRRVLRAKFELGLFETPFVDEAVAADAVDAGAHRALARRLAEQSMVLLKNDGVLPLRRDARVALIGPTADDARLLLGDHHYPVRGEPAYRESDRDADGDRSDGGNDFRPGPYFVDIVTPLAGIAEFVSPQYEAGCAVMGDDDSGISGAVSTARAADVAVVCVGGRSGRLPDCTSGESRDAAGLGLTGLQSRLLTEVAATGTPVVLVVIGGRAFALEAEAVLSAAVVMAWLPGEEGGRALARVLFGEVNPAGRLPVSLPRSVGQVPAYHNHRSGGGRSSPLGDYIDQATRPLYPFGHGLSYSEFEYVDLECPAAADVHASINLWVTVRNRSDRDGEEVVQVYLRDRVADVARPERKLVGFQRLPIPAGAVRRLKFVVDTSQLGYYDRRLRFVIDPGEVEVQVGASSRDIRLRGTVVLQGERRPLTQKQLVATQVEVREENEAP
jgi:beta-glucosidase